MLKPLFFLSAVALACTCFFLFTNPNELPAALLMIPVILIFAFFSLLGYLLLRFTVDTSTVSLKRQKSTSVLIGLAAALILLFQSSGGMVWADVILIGLILLISYIYISKF